MLSSIWRRVVCYITLDVSEQRGVSISAARWKQQVLPKSRQISTRRHGVKYQKTVSSHQTVLVTQIHTTCRTLPILHSEAAAHGTEHASLFCDEAEATNNDTNCTASTFVKIIKALSCFLLRERNACSVAQPHNFIKLAANCLQQHGLWLRNYL